MRNDLSQSSSWKKNFKQQQQQNNTSQKFYQPKNINDSKEKYCRLVEKEFEKPSPKEKFDLI